MTRLMKSVFACRQFSRGFATGRAKHVRQIELIRRVRAAPSGCSLDEVAFDRVLVPVKSDTGHIRDMQEAVFHHVRPLQKGIGPVLPLQPMRSFGNAHHVRGDLGIEMS